MLLTIETSSAVFACLCPLLYVAQSHDVRCAAETNFLSMESMLSIINIL